MLGPTFSGVGRINVFRSSRSKKAASRGADAPAEAVAHVKDLTDSERSEIDLDDGARPYSPSPQAFLKGGRYRVINHMDSMSPKPR